MDKVAAFNTWFKQEGKFQIPWGDQQAIKELLLVAWLKGSDYQCEQNLLEPGSKIRIISSTYFPTSETKLAIGTEATVYSVRWDDGTVNANTTAGLWTYRLSDVEVVNDEDNA